MDSVFVDTVAWLALLNSRDQLHTSAVEQMTQLEGNLLSLITTEFILLEVADALSSPSFRSQTVQFISGLQKMSFLEIVPISSELFEAGWELYKSRHDKEWGLTDCTSFVVMMDRKISIAFSADKHFIQAGFQNLM